MFVVTVAILFLMLVSPEAGAAGTLTFLFGLFLGGVFGISTISGAHRLFRPVPRTADRLVKSFYSELLNTHKPRFAVAYGMLAPVALEKESCSSLAEFENTWKETYRLIVRTTEEAFIQGTARCVICDAVGVGVWSYRPRIDDTAEPGDFLRCGVCSAVYCYRDFFTSAQRYCRRCGNPLGFLHHVFRSGQGVSLFAPVVTVTAFNEKPYSAEILRRGHKVTMEPQGERIARCIWEARTECWLQEPWRLAAQEQNITWRFENTAVKIGETWYLLSGEPGVLLAGNTPSALV
jgi:hypothetical protein